MILKTSSFVIDFPLTLCHLFTIKHLFLIYIIDMFLHFFTIKHLFLIYIIDMFLHNLYSNVCCMVIIKRFKSMYNIRQTTSQQEVVRFPFCIFCYTIIYVNAKHLFLAFKSASIELFVCTAVV